MNNLMAANCTNRTSVESLTYPRDICARFEPRECRNNLKAAGYAADLSPDALGAASSNLSDLGHL